MGFGQGGGDRLDRAIQAGAADLFLEQGRHVGPGRAADEDGFSRQVTQSIPADAVHEDRVRQHLGPVLGHGLLQGPASFPVRIDYVPIPFSHKGPPQGHFRRILAHRARITTERSG